MSRKKALVTGASSGIGKGIAKVLVKEGYDLAITYSRNKDGAMETKKYVEDNGGRCFVYQAELQLPDTAEKIVDKAYEDLGGMDLLVNNAGKTRLFWLPAITAENIDSVYNLNYRSYVLASAAASRHMIRDGVKGNIIFITSSRGERAYPNDAIYGGLKAALKRSCEAFATELAFYGIRVNCVAPGWTPREEYIERANQSSFAKSIPLGRAGTPEECGHAIAYLASEKAGYITGVSLRLDGGLILPGMPEGDRNWKLYDGIGRLKEMPDDVKKAIYGEDDE